MHQGDKLKIYKACKNNSQEIFRHKNDINVFIKHIRHADNEDRESWVRTWSY